MAELKKISRLFPPLVATCLVGTCCVLSGCSGSDEPKPGTEAALKEIPTTDAKTSSDIAEAELFYRAKKYFDSGIYSEAKQSLQSIVSNYPLGAYADFAQIKLADTAFETTDYPGAAAQYEEYYKNHPSSESSPYVLFRAARSNHLTQRGLGRDNTALEKAIKFYEELIQKFPGSAYSASAQEYRKDAHARLAAYEESVVGFYKKQNKVAAAEAREQLYKEKWPALLESDRAAIEVASGSKREEIERVAATLAPLPEASVNTPSTIATNLVQGATNSDLVSRLECSTEGMHGVVLFLNRQFSDPTFVAEHSKIEAEEGVVTLKLPVTVAKAGEVTCSDGLIGKLSEAGELTVSNVEHVQLLSINNPSRLIFLAR